MGFEPTTLGATVQCSTVELHSPSRHAGRPTTLFTYPPAACRERDSSHFAGLAGRAIGTTKSGRRGRIKRSLTRQEGIEPPTYGLEGRCSIRLSYWREVRTSVANIGVRGFEPPTPCAQGRCATRLRYTPRDRFPSAYRDGLRSANTVVFRKQGDRDAATSGIDRAVPSVSEPPPQSLVSTHRRLVGRARVLREQPSIRLTQGRHQVPGFLLGELTELLPAAADTPRAASGEVVGAPRV